MFIVTSWGLRMGVSFSPIRIKMFDHKIKVSVRATLYWFLVTFHSKKQQWTQTMPTSKTESPDPAKVKDWGLHLILQPYILWFERVVWEKILYFNIFCSETLNWVTAGTNMTILWMRLTFASFLNIGAVVGSSQHGHRIASVLSGEAVLKAPGQLVVKHMEGKLWNKHQDCQSNSGHVYTSEQIDNNLIVQDRGSLCCAVVLLLAAS